MRACSPNEESRTDEGRTSRPNQNRRMFGVDYRSDLDLVFCAPNGDYLKPDSISSKCSLIAKKAGLKSVSLHTLRHSHTNLLLSIRRPASGCGQTAGAFEPTLHSDALQPRLPREEEAAAEIWEVGLSGKPSRLKRSREFPEAERMFAYVCTAAVFTASY
jgi:hypothetical protein